MSNKRLKKILARNAKAARNCIGCRKPLTGRDRHHRVVDISVSFGGLELIVVGAPQHGRTPTSPPYQTTRVWLSPPEAEALSAMLHAKADEAPRGTRNLRFPFPVTRMTLVDCEGQDDDG
jgi:hypothetical protein